MSMIPDAAALLARDLCIGMSPRTASRFLPLMVGAVLATGRRTVTSMLCEVLDLVKGHFSSFHRVFSRARWSLLPMAKALAVHVVRLLPAEAPIMVAMDDTLTRHSGPRVYGRGMHRDAVNSSDCFLRRDWGHRWVVLAILVRVPLTSRHWALPVLCALYLARETAEKEGRRFRTPSELARQLALLLHRWFPGRKLEFLGDGGFASLKLAKSIDRHGGKLVARFHPDAALYAPPPRCAAPRRGRPRLRGPKLPSPEEVVANSTGRTRTIAWYGGERRRVILFSGTGLWYRSGRGVIAVRWVMVRYPDKHARDEWLYSTDITMSPSSIVETYIGRWWIETTFQECNEHLGLQSPRCRTPDAVTRMTPCLFGLHTVVALHFAAHVRRSGMGAARAVTTARPWYRKEEPTFSDALALMRRQIRARILVTCLGEAVVQKIPAQIREILLKRLRCAA